MGLINNPKICINFIYIRHDAYFTSNTALHTMYTVDDVEHP